MRPPPQTPQSPSHYHHHNQHNVSQLHQAPLSPLSPMINTNNNNVSPLHYHPYAATYNNNNHNNHHHYHSSSAAVGDGGGGGSIPQPSLSQQQMMMMMDPACELLAEKRRRNAGASARFRDRRKQREREMQEKCQFLEKRVQELENMDNAKRIVELEKSLGEAINEKESDKSRIRELEKEVERLSSKLCDSSEYVESLTPPCSSSGDYDSKDSVFEESMIAAVTKKTSSEASTTNSLPTPTTPETGPPIPTTKPARITNFN
nr:16003_t:CDS:2 [Entrophospora candida]